MRGPRGKIFVAPPGLTRSPRSTHQNYSVRLPQAILSRFRLHFKSTFEGMTFIGLLALLAIASTTCAQEFSQYTATNLPAFYAVESYLPYQGRVVASADGTYSATLSGPKNITDVAQAQVSDSSILNFRLATGIPKENQTWELYNYTISVPAGSLKSFESDVITSLNINGTAADASYLSLKVRGPSGSAKLKVTDLASSDIDVSTVGVGSPVLGLTDNVEMLQLNATGYGGASITGFSGKLTLNAQNLWNVLIGPSKDSLVINAFVTGDAPTKISYYSGTCSLMSTGANASCVQSPFVPPSVSTAG